MKNINKLAISIILTTALLLTACSNTITPPNDSIVNNTVTTHNNTTKIGSVEPIPMSVNGVEVENALLPGAYAADVVRYFYSVDDLLEWTLMSQWEELESIENINKMAEELGWSKEHYEQVVDYFYNHKPGVVVIGEFIDETSMGFHYGYHPDFEHEVMKGANAFNQLRVLEVLAGDIEVGDIITIRQYYSFDEDTKELISFEQLTPMHKGDRWIHFLWYSDGVYENVGDSAGRFPLPDKEIMQVMEEVNRKREEAQIPKTDSHTRTKFERMNKNGLIFPGIEITNKIDSSVLGVYGRSEFSFSLYAEVLDRFNIEAQDWVNPGRGYDTWLIEKRKNKMVGELAVAVAEHGKDVMRTHKGYVDFLIEEFGPEIMEQFE